MFRAKTNKYRPRLAFALGDLWPSLRFWWLTRETDYFPVFLLLGLATVMSAISIAIVQSMDSQADKRQVTCLALNIYHEARGEPTAGQYAVAEVTLNRVASSRYPNTICEVVYQKKWDYIRRRNVGAFSWTELEVKSNLKKKEWQRALTVAKSVYYQQQEPTLDGALFYHANSIRPSWARQKTPVARIGRHIFYR